MQLVDKITLALLRDICATRASRERIDVDKTDKLKKDCHKSGFRLKSNNPLVRLTSDIKYDLIHKGIRAYPKRPKYLNEYIDTNENWIALVQKVSKAPVKEKPKVIPRPVTALAENWGWSKNRYRSSIDTAIIFNARRDNNVQLVVKLKPYLIEGGIYCNGDSYKKGVQAPFEAIGFYPTPIIEQNGKMLVYNCSKVAKIDLNNRSTKYDANVYDEIYDCQPSYGDVPTNEKIYKDTLADKIGGGTDLFIAAYGQSGSGKSYLMMGPEDNSAKGMLHYTLENIACTSSKGCKITMIPLQIYNGSVYNAFLGPDRKDYDTNENWWNAIFEFLEGDAFSKKIPELNYVDMIDPRVPFREVPTASGMDTDYDPYHIHFPPSRDMILSWLGNSKRDIKEIREAFQGKASLDVTDKSANEIGNMINNLVRPARDTGLGLNAASSRSHLFVIFKIQRKQGSQLVTFADFGGIETFGNDPVITYERKCLVTRDLCVFRTMMAYYSRINTPGVHKDNRNDPFEQLPNNTKKTIDKSLRSNVIGLYGLALVHCTPNQAGSPTYYDKLGRKRIFTKVGNGLYSCRNSLTDGYLKRLQSSAMFNILRAVSGMYSANRCQHIVYLAMHKYANELNQRAICTTTNTVLHFAESFKPTNDGKASKE